MKRKLDQKAKGSWARALWTAAGAMTMGAVLTMAAPERAKAGDDFERGFKRELGAIAAHEVVGIGRHVLGGVVTGHHGYRHSDYRGRHDYRARRHYRYDRPYRLERQYRPYRYGVRSHRHNGWRHRPARRHVIEHHYYHGDHCGH